VVSSAVENTTDLKHFLTQSFKKSIKFDFLTRRDNASPTDLPLIERRSLVVVVVVGFGGEAGEELEPLG